MAKIVPPLVFREHAEYDGKYDAVPECELRPDETFKLLRAHALQQLYIICHANNELFSAVFKGQPSQKLYLVANIIPVLIAYHSHASCQGRTIHRENKTSKL